MILARELGFFISPKDARLSWTVGDKHLISWNTDYSAYTVGIWQEDPEGKSARSGLVILSQPDTKNGPYGLVNSFTWAVQTYHFDLNRSNEFFFWVFNSSDSSVQEKMNSGGTSVRGFTSPKFFIHAEPTPSTTTTGPSSTSTGALPTSPFPSQTALGGDKADKSPSVPVVVPAVLGSLLGLAVLAGVGWYLWRKKNATRKRTEKTLAEVEQAYNDKNRLGDSVLKEAPVEERPVEIHAEGRPVELG